MEAKPKFPLHLSVKVKQEGVWIISLLGLRSSKQTNTIIQYEDYATTLSLSHTHLVCKVCVRSASTATERRACEYNIKQAGWGGVGWGGFVVI